MFNLAENVSIWLFQETLILEYEHKCRNNMGRSTENEKITVKWIQVLFNQCLSWTPNVCYPMKQEDDRWATKIKEAIGRTQHGSYLDLSFHARKFCLMDSQGFQEKY